MTLDRKRVLALGVVLILLLATFLTAYYVRNFVTSTRGRATTPLAANEVNRQNLSEESVVEREDNTIHISLYKEEGSLYETQSTGEGAAREFIAENPHFETEEEAKQPKSLLQRFGLAPKGEELLPENVAAQSTLVRSSEDEKDPYLAHQGFRLEKDHYYYNQEIRDVPVFGATLAVHVKNDNEIYAVDGNLTQKTDIPRQRISEDRAKEIAFSQARKEASQAARLTFKETKKYVFNKAVIGLSNDATNHLALAITVDAPPSAAPFAKQYFVDVANGEIVYSISLIKEALERLIFDERDCPNNRCVLKRGEGQPPTDDLDMDGAYDYLGATYTFYKNNLNRDSYDNRGGTLSALTHKQGCSNAYWYGNGLSIFCDRMVTRDIVGHEFTHGVTEETANLIYSYQSGALNESISDIFAYAVDPNWTIGEGSALGIFRYMDDPPRLYNPARLFSSMYFCEAFDSGGVHTNSGVINKMFYLMVTGGNFNGCNLTGVGAQRAHAIIYRALTTYLTQISNFKAMYTAVNRACDDLYQPNSDTCNNVKKAMQATEIDQQADFTQTGAACSGQLRQTPACAPPPTPTPTLGAPSAEGKIVFSLHEGDSTHVYTINPNGSELRKISGDQYDDNLYPTLSKDGRLIAYITNRNKNIAVASHQGNLIRTITPPFPSPTNLSVPLFTPDGSTIFFFGRREGLLQSGIYSIRVDGSNLRTIIIPSTQELYAYPNDISPDGTKLLFTFFPNYYGELYLVNIDGTNRQNLTNTPTELESSASFSPDGQSIVFAAHGGVIDRMNLSTLARTRILSLSDMGPDTRVSSLSFSPNGNKIIFNEDGATADDRLIMFVVDADGRNLRKLVGSTTASAETLSNHSWAVDPGFQQPTPTGPITPMPTPTITPTPTLLPTPTHLPTATPIPTATPTPLPTATPIPTATPTPLPTATPTPAPPTPTPTCTPAPKNQGNANGDCGIDILDFNIWREEFLQQAASQTAGWRADFNSDNTVDLVDFSIWRFYAGMG